MKTPLHCIELITYLVLQCTEAYDLKHLLVMYRVSKNIVLQLTL
jgi:hypothetical protein